MSRQWKTTDNPNALTPVWTYHVEVCSFAFRFNSLEQVEEYLAYYRKKIHPSSADNAESSGCFQGDHWERQSRFDELPLYLREEPNVSMS